MKKYCIKFDFEEKSSMSCTCLEEVKTIVKNLLNDKDIYHIEIEIEDCDD